MPDLPAVTNNGKNTDGRHDVAANVVIKAEALILKKFDDRALQLPTLARAIFARPRPRTQPFPEESFTSALSSVSLVSLSQELDRVSDACGFSVSASGGDRRYGKSSANSTTYNARATHTYPIAHPFPENTLTVRRHRAVVKSCGFKISMASGISYSRDFYSLLYTCSISLNRAR